MEIILVIILCAAIFLAVVTYQGIVVRKYQIKTYKIKGNIKIVMLSDIHESSFGKNNRKLFEKIIELQPDVIALCGDILDKKLIVPSTQSLIKSLAQNYPCFYVAR